MKVGNIEFVAWTWLSDAYENFCTLVKNTYNYNGGFHSTMQVQYGCGEEYDLTEDKYKELEKEYPDWTEDERIDFFYSEICDRENLVLVSYDQLGRIEEVAKNKE